MFLSTEANLYPFPTQRSTTFAPTSGAGRVPKRPLDLRDRLVRGAEVDGCHPELAGGDDVRLDVVHEQAVGGAQACADSLHGQLVDRRVGLAHAYERGVDDHLEDL